MRRGAMAVLLAVLLGPGTALAEDPAPVAPETVVHTFADDAQMQAFAELWRQRQSAVLRMSVLQAYWNEEQAVLEQVNARLKQEFQVDPSKQYSLDPQRKVLLETPQPPATPAPGAGAP